MEESKKNKVIIFGTGQGGRNAYDVLKKRVQILGFADNDKKKEGKTLFGIPILSAPQLRETEFDFIVVASMYYKDIVRQLLNEIGIQAEKVEIF